MEVAPDRDCADELAEAVRTAAASRRALAICGSGSKRFYTGELAGEPLEVARHRGIVSYEPTELVLTARAGTPLAAVEAALAAERQMLAFEPPHFGPGATLGGAIASGFSGPRRPWGGSARDHVLGVRIVNGRGEILRFGGEVMKNVAGYDISRLVCGSFGTLAVLLEVSLKVLPRPEVEDTLVFEMSAAEAIERMSEWAGRPLPLSAAAHADGRLRLRLSGSEAGVRAARAKLGGIAGGEQSFWPQLREQSHPFFRAGTPVWRLSLPPAAAIPPLAGEWIIDWGGAQRWYRGEAPPAAVHAAAAALGGHAAPFRNVEAAAVRHALPAGLRRLHAELKCAFDPAGVLNPGLFDALFAARAA